MSVVASWALTIDANETLEDGVDASSSPVVNHAAFSTSGVYNAGSTVPATKVSYDSIALVAGAHTIDLQALPGTNGTTVNGDTLKVQLFKFKNTGTNAMTISEGAANGYALLGAAFSFILLKDQEVLFQLANTAPDIAAADSEIDIAGTGVETFQMSIVMG